MLHTLETDINVLNELIDRENQRTGKNVLPKQTRYYANPIAQFHELLRTLESNFNEYKILKALPDKKPIWRQIMSA